MVEAQISSQYRQKFEQLSNEGYVKDGLIAQLEQKVSDLTQSEEDLQAIVEDLKSQLKVAKVR